MRDKGEEHIDELQRRNTDNISLYVTWELLIFLQKGFAAKPSRTIHLIRTVYLRV